MSASITFPIKKLVLFVVLGLLGLGVGISYSQSNMTKEKMAKILSRETTITESDARSWQVTLKEITLVVVIDEKADRMRIISPVGLAKELKKKDYETLLQANFHTALDARYAIEGEYVWAAFIHPLKALEDEELISGLYQVRNLVLTYGTSYSSTSLIFGEEQK